MVEVVEVVEVVVEAARYLTKVIDTTFDTHRTEKALVIAIVIE